jgi:uncharacterized Zn finger protein
LTNGLFVKTFGENLRQLVIYFGEVSPMNVQLTEKQIHERASDKSFRKGQDYYGPGAIYNPARQSTPGGVVTLTAQCEGSSAPSYQLHVELDDDGVRSASCTCPYDWGGDCKHIVALLLMYIHEPDGFSEQKSVSELLEGMEKAALVALILRLVERDPDLYDALELAIPAAKIAAQPTASGAERKRQIQVSEQTYRKQINRILKGAYRGYYYYDDYYDDWSKPGYVDDLEEVRETAVKFLEVGDDEGALIILRVLLEELTEDYDGEMDYNGDLASVIQDIGMPLAEAILSVKLESSTHSELERAFQEVFDDLDETIEESELEVILAALEHGWEELPDEDTEWETYEEEYWMVLDQLKQARLNVLARKGDDDAFLGLAEKSDAKRYTLKLIELGRLDEAVEASEKLENTNDAFAVAQKLREVGRLKDAVALAEKGLELGGYYLNQLALWLAPLEESQGRTEMALLAYRTAYIESPSIEIYRHIKRLAGTNWENLQPALIQKADEKYSKDTLVDIHLEEDDWDAAIQIAEKDSWSFNLLEKVADAVIPYRPDWVICVSLKQSDDLIEKTQSKLYPIAAHWLERAKKAYQQKGQNAEWQAYINNLRTTYARRPALQREIQRL